MSNNKLGLYWKFPILFIFISLFFLHNPPQQASAQVCADLTTSPRSSIRCVGSGTLDPTYTCQTGTVGGGQRCVGSPGSCSATQYYGTYCNVSGGGYVCDDDYGPHTVSCGTSGGGGNPPPPPPGGGPTPTPTPFHLGCQGMNCVRIPGASQGGDAPCGAAQNNAPACTYRGCDNGRCVLKAGAGEANRCNDDNQGTGDQDCSCPGAAGCSTPPPPPPPTGCRTSGQTCGAQIGSCCSPLQCQGGNTCQPCRTSGQTCGGGAGACCSGLTCNTTCQGTANPPPPPPSSHNVCAVGCMCQRVSGAGTNSCSSPGAFGCTPPIPGDINGNTPGTQGAVRVTLDAPSSIPIGYQPQLTVEITDNSNGSALPFPDYPYIVTWNGSCTTPNTTCTGGPQTTGTINASECTGVSFNRNCKFSLTAPAGVYTNGGTTYPISMYVTSTKINSRGYYTTYVLTSCPATAPPPAPDTSNWIQLRDSSFAGLGPLNNPIPAGIENRYFVTCTTSPTCTTNDPGEVVASTIDLGGAPTSPKGWQATGTVFSPTTSVSSFISYVKARKPYVGPLTSVTSTGTSDTIYYITGDQAHSVATQESAIRAGDRKVYIIDGNLTINTDFNTSNRSLAIFVKGNLNIDPSVTIINGVFVVQGTVNTGTATNSTLVVNGNLISQDSLINGRASGNDATPSLTIRFAPKLYMDLLPLLSVTTYDWKQLQ